MRIKLFVLAGAVFAIIGRVGAGSMELAPKETAPPTITQSEPWQFTIAAPGWLASLNGTIGIRGINADIDVPVDEVLQHLDMIFAMRAEAQKGPFGIYGEVIYIGLSDGAQINGLINNIHENRPDIPIGPLGGRIRQEIAQRVEQFIELKKTELRARVDALVERGLDRRAAVERVVNEAKARIANQLAVRLNKRLSQTLSRDDYWFDPYVGLRARYNFNRTYYTAVRGEIGGFGVGADLMWEVETVVGINLTRSIFTEIGYRALGGNYENNGFRFDAVMHGPQITTGITF